jgi:hypothetical protein
VKIGYNISMKRSTFAVMWLLCATVIILLVIIASMAHP